MTIKVELGEEEAEALVAVLEGVLAEMSSEIAATENPSFRAELNQRRDVLRTVRTKLTASP